MQQRAGIFEFQDPDSSSRRKTAVEDECRHKAINAYGSFKNTSSVLALHIKSTQIDLIMSANRLQQQQQQPICSQARSLTQHNYDNYYLLI